MTITIIGSGNVATHLGTALAENGCTIESVYSRTLESARLLAEQLGSGYTNDISSIPQDSDIVLFSISDDALPVMIEAVRRKNSKAIFLHTAGSVSMDVFKGYADNYGVVYPLQTFSKKRSIDMSEVPFFIEANNQPTAETIAAVIGKISHSVTVATSDVRRKLHLAAVFACNFANHCYALADKILKDENLPFDVLKPLIRETADKINYLSPVEAQTGPAVRYDKTVMNRQMDLLKDSKDKEIYRLMSDSINKEYNDKLRLTKD